MYPISKIKVFIVDDSALIRQTISLILKDNLWVEVIGTAFNPYNATEKLQTLKPDVILLDIQMPEMDGLTFLRKLMKQQPLPVIIFSSYAEEGSFNALKAFEYGAIEVIEKPKFSTTNELEKYKDKLTDAIKTAALANVKAKSVETDSKKEIIYEIKHKISPINHEIVNFVVAIGASTGGTEAIKRVLEEIPENFPPIVVTQHMPEGFTNSFAKRLDSLSKITVKEAENNDILKFGHAYIANGGKHLEIKKQLTNFQLVLSDTPPVNRHKPAVDVMFKSVADNFGSNAIGVILTGMGADGSKGLKEMKAKGAHTIAQDENSCIVFGMPKVAISIGAVDMVLPIYDIARYLQKIISPTK